MLSNAVFISYRRSTNEADAYILYQGLKLREIDTFFDYLSIKEGNWLDTIRHQIAARPYFVLLLAPGSLERCPDPEDILRREIQEAIRHKRKIIPIYTPNFNWGDLDKYLDDADTKAIKGRQAVKWPAEPSYKEYTLNDLVQNYLKEIDLDLADVPTADEEMLARNYEKIQSLPPAQIDTTSMPKRHSSRRLSGAIGSVAALAIITMMIVLNNVVNPRDSSKTPTAATSPTATDENEQTAVARAFAQDTQAALDVIASYTQTPTSTRTGTPNGTGTVRAIKNATETAWVVASFTKTPTPTHTLTSTATSTSTPTLPPPFTGHDLYVGSIAFSPDSRYIVSGSGDKTIRLWEAKTGALLKTFTGHTNAITSVAFSPDGRYLVSGSSDKTVRVWDVANRTLLKTLTENVNPVLSVAYSPNGDYIASGGADYTVRIWNAKTRMPIRTLLGHKKPVQSVSFSPDGRYLTSASNDESVRIWNVVTGTFQKSFYEPNSVLRSVAYSLNGRYIVAGGDSRVFVWEAATGVSKTLKGHNNIVWGVAYSPDGHFIVSGSEDDTVRVWDTASGKTIQTFTDHKGDVYTVAYSPDGCLIASAGEDKTIIVRYAPQFNPTPTATATR